MTPSGTLRECVLSPLDTRSRGRDNPGVVPPLPRRPPMTLVGQPPPSPALQKSYDLLAAGSAEDAETVVRKAALAAKAQHGSGSHPLALAYADMARFHLRVGQAERAAKEFLH